MKVYVCIVSERHTDPDVTVWSTPEAAVQDARDTADACRRGQTPHEVDVSDALIWIQWGSEGDSVWVLEREVDQP